MNSLTLPLLLGAALVLPAAQPSHTETRTEALPMGAKLWISQEDGKVDVKGWDKPEVQVVAEYYQGTGGREAKLEWQRVADGLELKVQHPRHPHFALFMFGRNSDPIINLTLMVPRKLSMYVRSVDGAISVQDLEGYADCHAVDGPIILGGISGEVHAHTVDGTITARNLKARFKGGTVDGNITLAQVEGGVELQTVDGSIRADELDGWGEGLAFRSVDGNIRVKLGQAKGNLEAKAVDGTIHTTLPGLARGRDNTLSGQIPGRDQKIAFHTVDGNIDIE